ncbi:MAG: hypothetical protein ABSE89_00600 [Sedimentisphaerales bacterium]
MDSLNRTKPVGHLNIIRIFLFAIIAVAVFPKPCLAKRFTAEEEYKAQKKLLQLQTSVDDEDYLRAQLILGSFEKSFSGTNCYKIHSKRINELAGKIREETQNIKVEDKIEYLFVPASVETKQWKEDMSKAEMLISQNNDKIGIAVLRVIFEDEDIEQPSVRIDWNGDNQLNIYNRGGYSCVDTFQSGKAVFIGSQFWRCDPNDKDVSATGDIIIGGIYHYPTRFKVNVQRGKAIAIGEVIVRSIPKEFCGNLMVKVEAEEGLKLAGGAVRLSPYGFYSGKTEPVKNGSCLFNSVGPGSYSVAIASNNIFNGPGQSAEVVSGQTTKVTINAYRHRLIEFDWRFRDVNEPNNWLSGRKIMKTKESWQPDEEWPDVHYPVVEFGDWIENTCKIRSSNGNLMCVDTNEPFEKMDFPLNFSHSYRDYPIKEGDIFAWHRDDRKERILEALIHITKITPIKVPACSDEKNKGQKLKIE